MSIAGYLDPALWAEDGTGPRFARLRRRLEEAIEAGLLPPDSPLPAEREIAALTGLSRVTVRRAIQDLVEQGRVVQKQGSGSFVRGGPRVEQSLTRLTSFTEDMAARGRETTAQWLERGLFRPAPDEVAALGLAPGAEVARLARLRLSDGRPMAIERASLPSDLLPNPLAVTGSLYDALDADGRRPVRAVQRITAINLNAADADLLGVPEAAAGLRIARTSYLDSGRVVEFTKSVYRGDAYDFVAELRLVREKDMP